MDSYEELDRWTLNVVVDREGLGQELVVGKRGRRR
jgi:hypothetical protein